MGISRTFVAGVAALMAWTLSACAQETDTFQQAREDMVYMLTKGIFGRTPVRDEAVLDAMRSVHRHEFVPERIRNDAYADTPLPIGEGQTISQPYIVARMTELLKLEPGDRVLEIGTGSGYQAAVLAELCEDVYTIEIVEPLGKRARAVLERLKYTNIRFRIGDGYKGWPEAAPFDAIMVTAAPDHVPQPLVEQLRPGGRMVIPVGRQRGIQKLQVITKNVDGSTTTETVDEVRFVPLTRDRDEQ